MHPSTTYTSNSGLTAKFTLTNTFCFYFITLSITLLSRLVTSVPSIVSNGRLLNKVLNNV